MAQTSHPLFALTFKKSKNRRTWQTKRRNHDIVTLHWMTDILEHCLTRLGCDPDDSSAVYRLDFAAETFAGSQFRLDRDNPVRSAYSEKATNLFGVYYELRRAEPVRVGSEIVRLQVFKRNSSAPDSPAGFVSPAIVEYFPEVPTGDSLSHRSCHRGHLGELSEVSLRLDMKIP